MGERKVLNKYYPPDFDPAKLPRAKRPKNQQIKVRMMLPMSIRCSLRGNYIYKGTKFNSRMEDVIGEMYLGFQVFRFYFKRTKCSAEITMKTDPQNSDYVVESGATRNFEPWREKDEEADKEKRKREHEEMGDAMKSLENRTMDSKREMDILAALDEMKSMKVTELAYYLGQLRWKNLAAMVLSFGPAFAMVLPAHGKAESKTCRQMLYHLFEAFGKDMYNLRWHLINNDRRWPSQVPSFLCLFRKVVQRRLCQFRYCTGIFIHFE